MIAISNQLPIVNFVAKRTFKSNNFKKKTKHLISKCKNLSHLKNKKLRKDLNKCKNFKIPSLIKVKWLKSLKSKFLLFKLIKTKFEISLTSFEMWIRKLEIQIYTIKWTLNSMKWFFCQELAQVPIISSTFNKFGYISMSILKALLQLSLKNIFQKMGD